MKALKEKRNSFRSLWRMGLVILSVFALTFAVVACGDSNTGSPDYVPPVAPPVNGGISGPGSGANGEGEGEVAAKIERLNVVYNPYDTRVSGIANKQDPGRASSAVTAWSAEGQAPVLTGIRVEAWYDNGSMKYLAANQLSTIPAILGQEYVGEMITLTSEATSVAIASGSVVTKAETKTIYVYSTADGGPIVPVTIPGVRGILYDTDTGRGSQNAGYYTSPFGSLTAPNPTKTANRVWGNNGTGIRFGGSGLAGDFFEDGEGPTVSNLAGIQVDVKYAGLVATTATPGSAVGIMLPSVDWERIPLTAGHVFDGYYSGFASTSATTTPTETAGKRYAYGLDHNAQRVYLLISKGTTHGGSGNTSIYIEAPYGSAAYHYVRDVEVVSVAWVNNQTPVGATAPQDIGFYRENDISARTLDQWDQALITGNITMKVYYHDYASPIERGVDFFRRAVDLKRAGVIAGVTLGDPDEETYGDLSIGYYSAILSTARNYDFYGEFPNFAITKVPIGSFVEGSGELKVKATVPPETLPLKFVNNTNGSLSAAQFEAIQNSYDLVGTFSYPGKADVQLILIPGAQFQPDYFRGTPLRVTEPETVSIEMTVPRTETRLAYRLYVGEEGSLDAVAYPAGYDGRDTVQ